ncbi:MAG TPA: radical SAM protein, partial [Syntrophobacteraceae bacterium]|nr:radical SAM protein [Syntrophobacteraceae bacterium]
MNYLLVMPKSLASIEHFNIFPIGLAYVSASLKSCGFSVYTANLDYVEGDTDSALNKLITDNDIDVICTGGLSRDCHKLREIIDTARRIKSDIISIVGGGVISSDPQPAMRVLGADIGVIGEGEITICELARALDNDQPYESISGLIYRDKNNGLVTTSPREEIADIDSIPFPDFEGFDYEKWVKSANAGLILTDRSCPFNCTFCYHPTGSKYRQRSLDNIFKELDYQVQRYGIETVGLSSELFSINKDRVIDFCNRIMKHHISWGCCLRVPDVDADLLSRMKASGCVNVCMGLESADNSILKSMRKNITVEQIERALTLTHEAGINIESGFIFGDINETKETVANTLNFWHRHKDVHYMNLTMIYVFPGSYLYRYACERGIIKDREQFLRDGCPLINVSKLTDSEYRDVTSLITELRLHPHVPVKSSQIASIESGGECNTESFCRKCGAPSETSVMFWYGKEIRCPACGLINFVDPFQNALHLEDAFIAQLPVDRNIVLWGAGGVYYKLMGKYPVLASDRFLLVDKNPAQQGLTICGKKIHSPDIIVQDNIRTVVITALSRKEEIRATLESDYHTVEIVLVPDFDILELGIVPVLKHAAVFHRSLA